MDQRIPLTKGRDFNDYNVKKCIGSTSNMLFYLCTKIGSNENVILKEVYPYELAFEDKVYRNLLTQQLSYEVDPSSYYKIIKAEKRILKNIDEDINLKVIKIFDKEYSFIENVKGELLSQIIDVHKINSLTTILKLIISIVNLIEQLHSKKFIHGDICPSIFLVDNIESPIVKCIDYTISFNINNAKNRIINKKNDYLPLELINHDRNSQICFGSDIYSIGCIFFRLLYGDLYRPLKYKIKLEQELLISPYFKNIHKDIIIKVKKILYKMVSDRNYTTKEIKEDLTRCLNMIIDKDTK